MSDESIVTNGAPTLAGLKTGNLFLSEYTSKEAMQAEIRSFNRILSPKGIILLPMRWSEKRVLIYLYRPAMLRKDLQDKQAAELLDGMGYHSVDAAACVRELRKRLNDSEAFPHEIGLFLSYPPEDVRGFIEHRDTGCKCIGCWRVYGDEAAAKAKFTAFKRCTDSYRKWLDKGFSLAGLVVNV